jgi:chromosome segregation ATPase
MALVAALAALMALWGGSVVAETRAIEAGEPAPAGGVWLDDQAAERAAQDLQEARKRAAELEVARAALAERAAQVEDLTRHVTALKDAVANLQGQAATAARLDEVRGQVDEITTKALRLAASSLDTQAKLNEANLRTLEQSNKALEMVNAEIARLRTRGIWDDVKSLMFGLAAFFAGKAW